MLATSIALDLRAAPQLDYAELFEEAPTSLMLLDASGVIVHLNAAGAALLGCGDGASLAGRPFAHWVVDDDQPRLHGHLAAARSSRRCVTQELRVRNRRGHVRVLRLHSRQGPDRPGFGDTVASTLLDVSAEQRAARKLRRLQSQLMRIARSHAVGELASGLADQLNQPLATVVLDCEAALDSLGGDDGGAAADTVRQARDAAVFAERIVSWLRGFLSKNNELREDREIGALIRDVAAQIDAETPDNGATLEVRLDEPLPAVHVDPVQIEEVLLNLVHDSLEAIDAQEAEPQRVEIAATAVSHEFVRVSVSDTGIDMTSARRERMLEPFSATQREGTDMSLAISRAIVEAHGGKLWADSLSGKGTTFHLTLPVAANA